LFFTGSSISYFAKKIHLVLDRVEFKVAAESEQVGRRLIQKKALVGESLFYCTIR
jgi:hypothetical protein